MNFSMKMDYGKLSRDLKIKRELLKKVVEETVVEVNAEDIIKDEYYKSPLRVRSSILINSFKTENKVNKTQGLYSKRVWSIIRYARIHDKGGYNGVGHKAYQKPTYYFTNASKRIWDTIIKTINMKLGK